MMAYLTNDAESWLEWYGENRKKSKRWGTTEDGYMIETLLEGSSYDSSVHGYQQWHNAEAPRLGGYEALDEDGKIGAETRKQLILDYMHREDTTVPEGTPILVHGCGEYFPLESSGEKLDTKAADGQHEQEDRRVEVYLFPRELGVLPPVPGTKAKKGEKEYGEWRHRAVSVELAASLERDRVEIHLFDRDEQPMLGARWRLDWGDGTTTEGIAEDGWVRLAVNQCLPGCTLEWGKSESDNVQDYLYALQLSLGCSAVTDTQERQKQMLNNMGYDVSDSLDIAVRAFQENSGQAVTGLVDNAIPADTGKAIEQKYVTLCED